MPTEANPSLLKDLNYKGRDVEGMRSRRTGVNFKLRKAKKEDHLQRQNLKINDEPLSRLQEQNRMAAANISIDDIVNGINSGGKKKEITATHAARKILSRECNPPSDNLINANIVPKLVEFLSRVDNPDFQFELAWALTNIALGTSDQTKPVVSAGAVAGFISLLGSPHPVVAEQAVWALSNIAGDGPEFRHHVIEQGIINPLLTLIKPDSSATFLRNVTWTLSNLSRNKDSSPSLHVELELLRALVDLSHRNDKEIRADAYWALSYFTDRPYLRMHKVVDAGVVPLPVAVLDHVEAAVITPNLRTVRKAKKEDHLLKRRNLENFDKQFPEVKALWQRRCHLDEKNNVVTKAVVSAGAVAGFIPPLGSPRPVVAEPAVWALVNIEHRAHSTSGNIEPGDGPELRDRDFYSYLKACCQAWFY